MAIAVVTIKISETRRLALGKELLTFIYSGSQAQIEDLRQLNQRPRGKELRQEGGAGTYRCDYGSIVVENQIEPLDAPGP